MGLSMVVSALYLLMPRIWPLPLIMPLAFALIRGFASHPEKFILWIAVYTPFEDFVLKWLPSNVQRYARFVPEALILAVIIAVILEYWRKQKRFWPSDILNVPLIMFLYAAVASALLNTVPFHIVLASLKNILRYVALYYMIILLNPSGDFIRQLTKIMMTVAIIQAILAIAESAGLPVAQLLRSQTTSHSLLTGIENPIAAIARAKPSGTIGIYSAYGSFLVFWTLPALAGFLESKERKYLFGYALLVTGIILSRSRTSWISVIFGTLLIVFYFNRHHRLFVRSILISLTALFFIVIILMSTTNLSRWQEKLSQTDWKSLIVSSDSSDIVAQPETVSQRLKEFFSGDYWHTASRLHTFAVTLPEILRKYPLLGLGPGTMGSEVTGGGSTSPGYYPEYSHEHWLETPHHIAVWTADSGWVAMLAQFGLLGLLPWWVFFYQLFRKTVSNIKHATAPWIRWVSIGMAANIITIFIGVFSIHFMTYRAISLYFWIWGAFMVNRHARTFSQ